MGERRQKWHALHRRKTKNRYTIIHPASVVFFPTRHVASKTRVLFDGLSLKKAQYILETSSFTPSLAKKTKRVLLPEMRLDRV
jgi:hypothetical protein